MASSPQHVDLHFIKTPAFRVIHVDGMYGELSPHGYIHTTIYSERPAIPKKSRVTVNELGGFEREEVLETIGGVVRELEADLVMNFTTAASFLFWLESKVEALRKAIAVSDDDWEKLKTTQREMNAKLGG